MAISEIDVDKITRKENLSPIDEALLILAKYDEGTPPRKWGYED